MNMIIKLPAKMDLPRVWHLIKQLRSHTMVCNASFCGCSLPPKSGVGNEIWVELRNDICSGTAEAGAAVESIAMLTVDAGACGAQFVLQDEVVAVCEA